MLLYKLRRLVGTLFLKANGLAIIGLTFGYILVSYGLMYWAGESDLIHSDNFAYWLIVTGSTVGYGDLSPSTAAGKWAVSLWVIPFGLSLFALVITKFGYFISEMTLKGRRGLRMLDYEGHTVIIGWNGSRTLRLIDLLLAKSDRSLKEVVLCVDEDMENPLVGKIGFVTVDRYSNDEAMARTNLSKAHSIIIDTPKDDVTLTTALYCDKANPNCHTTAYFADENVGELLLNHCPRIECIPSVSIEMLAKSTVDPGSSLLHKQLLDSTEGMTQYSMVYEGEAAPFKSLFYHLKSSFDCTVIGIKRASDKSISINPSLDETLHSGDTLFYIAEKRLQSGQCFKDVS